MKKHLWLYPAFFLLGICAGISLGALLLSGQKTPPAFSSPPNFPLPVPDTLPPILSPPNREDSVLPCAMKFTPLIARGLEAYSGPDPDEKSSVPLEKVAALILENTGTAGIDFVRIILVQNGRELTFDATYLPPRATILIPESSRAKYRNLPAEACRCHTMVPGSFELADRKVSILPGAAGKLEVTNRTEDALPCVRIYYKRHIGSRDLYAGTMTYSAIVPALRPRETRVIAPYLYTQNEFSIVAVEIDST